MLSESLRLVRFRALVGNINIIITATKAAIGI